MSRLRTSRLDLCSGAKGESRQSWRSRDRAGLRYQRRGIDDEGHVANMVETEMIVRAKVCGIVTAGSG